MFLSVVTLVLEAWLILTFTTVLEGPLATLTGICLAQSTFTSTRRVWYVHNFDKCSYLITASSIFILLYVSHKVTLKEGMKKKRDR